MMPRLLLLLVIFLALASPAGAAYRVEVVGEASAGDQVGALLLDSVRARVGRFSGMSLDTSGDRFRIEIATLDPDKGANAGVRTAYGVAYILIEGSTWRYLSHNVGICGVIRVEQVALAIVSDLGKMIAALAAKAESSASPGVTAAPHPSAPKWETKTSAPESRAILRAMTLLADVRTALAAPHPDYAATCARAREAAAAVASLAPSREVQKAVDYAKRGADACSAASKVTTLMQFALAREQLQLLVR